MNAWKHFKKICIHKKWVFYYCCKCGIPWQGIKHDLSKFSPIEFFESIKYYNGIDSPINLCKEKNGYSMAWFHHKGRNPHHYEYWVDNLDNGGKAIQMPFKYALELICDYLGAGRAYQGNNFTYQKEYEWWLKRIEHPLLIHPQTKAFISSILELLADAENNNYMINSYFNKAYLEILYTRLTIN